VAARTFYRVVKTDPPTLADFTSNAARGRPLLDPSPETRRLWAGLSVNATEAPARRRARQHPALGAWVACLELPAAAPVQIERTTRIPGHHTLWGEPAVLLGCVVAVVPV
jgi:hypothetical protein